MKMKMMILLNKTLLLINPKTIWWWWWYWIQALFLINPKTIWWRWRWWWYWIPTPLLINLKTIWWRWWWYWIKTLLLINPKTIRWWWRWILNIEYLLLINTTSFHIICRLGQSPRASAVQSTLLILVLAKKNSKKGRWWYLFLINWKGRWWCQCLFLINWKERQRNNESPSYPLSTSLLLWPDRWHDCWPECWPDWHLIAGQTWLLTVISPFQFVPQPSRLGHPIVTERTWWRWWGLRWWRDDDEGVNNNSRVNIVSWSQHEVGCFLLRTKPASSYDNSSPPTPCQHHHTYILVTQLHQPAAAIFSWSVKNFPGRWKFSSVRIFFVWQSLRKLCHYVNFAHITLLTSLISQHYWWNIFWFFHQWSCIMLYICMILHP